MTWFDWFLVAIILFELGVIQAVKTAREGE
jgi:hypothetical protein